MRFIAFLAVLSCASSKSAEQHAEVAATTHTEAQAAQTLQQETHSEEGEWTRRTWEFAPGNTKAPAEAGARAEQDGYPTPHNSDPSSKSIVPQAADAGHPSFLGWPTEGDAPLLRYTEETHAPAHVDTTTVAGATQATKQDTSLKAASEAHSASKWRVGLPWLLLLPIAMALWLARGKLKLALEAVRAMVG